MMDLVFDFLGSVALPFILGGWFGMRLEAEHWRRNAHKIQRIESGGRIYKVTLDEE